MIAPLELVEGMPLTPHHCVLCGNNPVDEQTGRQLEHVFAPGVDVDWGSSVYVCHSCGQLIADLYGRVTVDGYDKLVTKNEQLETKVRKLEKGLAKARGLLERINDGKKAVKEAKAVK